jgi:hypothetical protein
MDNYLFVLIAPITPTLPHPVLRPASTLPIDKFAEIARPYLVEKFVIAFGRF